MSYLFCLDSWPQRMPLRLRKYEENYTWLRIALKSKLIKYTNKTNLVKILKISIRRRTIFHNYFSIYLYWIGSFIKIVYCRSTKYLNIVSKVLILLNSHVVFYWHLLRSQKLQRSNSTLLQLDIDTFDFSKNSFLNKQLIFISQYEADKIKHRRCHS